MRINEIFRSIQGESSFAGLPCTFIRFTGCNLRCSYCDTPYAFYEGNEATVEGVIKEITGQTTQSYGLIEITGGEPLLQEEVYPLVKELLDLGYKILVETNGSIDIGRLDRRVIRIVDIKTPKSGMADKMDFKNIRRLTRKDEVKFVISDREDYEWSKEILERYKFPCKILFSPVYGRLEPAILSEWILYDNVPVRLNLQLHKYIWGIESSEEMPSELKTFNTRDDIL